MDFVELRLISIGFVIGFTLSIIIWLLTMP
jgi:type III secretory pathway component EscT